jgi:hypothetical protein
MYGPPKHATEAAGRQSRQFFELSYSSFPKPYIDSKTGFGFAITYITDALDPHARLETPKTVLLAPGFFLGSP